MTWGMIIVILCAIGLAYISEVNRERAQRYWKHAKRDDI